MDSGTKEKPALSNRQKEIRRREIAAQKKADADRLAALGHVSGAAAPEVYLPAVAKHEDDRVIPGLTGKGAIQRLDTLGKLWESGKITPQQYSAGRDYLAIVENYFACASGLARLSEEAGRVGGDGDPIRRYLKGRPVRLERDGKVSGYIPTQRPRNPSSYRPGSDGWTATKLAAMSEFSRMAKLVDRLPRDARNALCVLVIDPARPDLPALDMAAACRRMFGDKNARRYAILTRWLCEALDEIDGELMEKSAKAA